MNKIYLIIPAILLIGSFGLFYKHFFTLHEKQEIIENEVIKTTNVTFLEWNDCIQNAKIGFCDELPEFRRNTCYYTSNETNKLIQPFSQDAPEECNSFWSLFEQAKGDDLINQDGHYVNCFTMESVIKASQGDPFYYYTIFAPKYLACAGLSQN